MVPNGEKLKLTAEDYRSALTYVFRFSNLIQLPVGFQLKLPKFLGFADFWPIIGRQGDKDLTAMKEARTWANSERVFSMFIRHFD